MPSKDELSGQAVQAKGKAKEKAGELTDNEQMEEEGRIEQVEGKIREKAEEVKEKVEERR